MEVVRKQLFCSIVVLGLCEAYIILRSRGRMCPEDPNSRTITLGKFQCYITCKASQLMSDGMG